MKQTAVEWLVEKLHRIKRGSEIGHIIEQAKEMENTQKGYSYDDLMESFIEGYKQRAELGDAIFDNTSRMFAIDLFKKFKNK